MDSRFFLSEESGTVPTTAVQRRALDNGIAPVVLGLTVVLGAFLIVGGAVCVLVGGLAHQRREGRTSSMSSRRRVSGSPAPYRR